MQDDQTEAMGFLARAGTFGDEVPTERIDTHAAVVFLHGQKAYKMKKAVTFPFLDFSTLALRHEALERELRINRPNAPEIYRRVLPVTRAADGALAIDGDGAPVEWLLEMQRFDVAATLDRACARGRLDAELVDRLAASVAAAQARAPRREAAPWIADLADYVAQNDRAFRADAGLYPPDRVYRLTRAAEAWLARIRGLLVERGRLGLIRLTHGDLHAGNIVVIDDVPTLFDAIEFDDRIATGDLLYDVGFLIMDLDDRGQRPAANRLLGRWLVETARRAAEGIEDQQARLSRIGHELQTQSGGLAALPFFLMMRAAIRSKVTAAKLPWLNGAAHAAAAGEARHYFDVAAADLEPSEPMLVAIGGLSGTGKSTLAAALAPLLGRNPGALHLRSDVLRKLLAGVDDHERLPATAYTPEASQAVYSLLLSTARAALAAGWSVIIDAVSARPEERAAMAELARMLEVRFAGLWLEALQPVLADRVTRRSGDASDADARVVAFQGGLATGPIEWTRIAADRGPDATLMSARAVLGL